MADIGEDEITQATNASAFSNGKNQLISNVSVQNATRDIVTIIFEAPQPNLPQFTPESSLLQKLFVLASHFFTGNLEEISGREIPQEEPMSSTDLDSGNDDDNESVIADDSEVTCVSMTPSYKKSFIPLEAVNRGPSSCGTYIEQMFPLKYDYPLWIPEPNQHLPVEYRRKGVSIGDVGVITPEGGFDFLFNIYLLTLHPINPDDIPDDFDSTPRPKQRTSFQNLFTSGSKVSSLDIESDIDVNTKDISYTCKNGNRGAILSLPHGASQENLKNELDLKEFISKNALSWYRYALVTCGLEVDRHSLYPITGCTKSRTWGIATFDTESQEPHGMLVLGESHNADDDPSYIWKKSGGARSFRLGPSTDPDLRAEDCNQNQTLFLRGFKVSLSEDAWNNIRHPVDIECFDKNGETTLSPDKSRNPKGGKESPNDSNVSGIQSSFTNLRQEISISDFPATTTPFHPLNAINDMIFSQTPQACIAITHDNLWCKNIAEG